MVLAAIGAVGLALWLGSRRRMPIWKVASTLIIMAVSVPVGARLLDVITKSDLYVRQPQTVLSLELSGFSLYGGLILASVAGVLVCRISSLGLLTMADIVAPALGLGIAVMRVGCFLAGCSFGSVSDLPWAVTFPAGSEAHVYQLLHGGVFAWGAQPLPVHPTQLYESGAGLAGIALSAWVLRRRTFSGASFAAFAVWFNGFRLGNHLLRAQQTPLGVPDGFYPALYASLLGAAAAWLVWQYAWPKRSAEAVGRYGAATSGATG